MSCLPFWQEGPTPAPHFCWQTESPCPEWPLLSAPQQGALGKGKAAPGEGLSASLCTPLTEAVWFVIGLYCLQTFLCICTCLKRGLRAGQLPACPSRLLLYLWAPCQLCQWKAPVGDPRAGARKKPPSASYGISSVACKPCDGPTTISSQNVSDSEGLVYHLLSSSLSSRDRVAASHCY